MDKIEKDTKCHCSNLLLDLSADGLTLQWDLERFFEANYYSRKARICSIRLTKDDISVIMSGASKALRNTASE